MPDLTSSVLPIPISRNLASATTYLLMTGNGIHKVTANMAQFLGTILEKASFDCLVAFRGKATGPWTVFGAGSSELGTPSVVLGPEFMGEFAGLKRVLRCGACGVKPRHQVEECPLFSHADKARGPALTPIKSGPKDVLTWVDTRIPDLDVQDTLRFLMSEFGKQSAQNLDLTARLAAMEVVASNADITEGELIVNGYMGANGLIVPAPNAAPATPTPAPVKKARGKKASKKE